MKKIMAFLKNKKISLPLHTIVIVSGVFLLLLFVCCSSHITNIAVVNMNRVYAEAKVFQSIHDEQQAFENEWKEKPWQKRKN